MVLALGRHSWRTLRSGENRRGETRLKPGQEHPAEIGERHPRLHPKRGCQLGHNKGQEALRPVTAEDGLSSHRRETVPKTTGQPTTTVMKRKDGPRTFHTTALADRMKAKVGTIATGVVLPHAFLERLIRVNGLSASVRCGALAAVQRAISPPA